MSADKMSSDEQRRQSRRYGVTAAIVLGALALGIVTLAVPGPASIIQGGEQDGGQDVPDAGQGVQAIRQHVQDAGPRPVMEASTGDVLEDGGLDLLSSDEDLQVTVLADGQIMLGDVLLTEEKLQRVFDSSRQQRPDTLVLVQSEQGAPREKVMRVMELAKAAGLAHLAIGVRPASP